MHVPISTRHNSQKVGKTPNVFNKRMDKLMSPPNETLLSHEKGVKYCYLLHMKLSERGETQNTTYCMSMST